MTEPFRIQSGADAPCGGCCAPFPCDAQLLACPSWPPSTVTTAIAGVASCEETGGGACDFGRGDLVVCVNDDVTMALVSAVQCQWIFVGRCTKFYDSAVLDLRTSVDASYSLVVDFLSDGSVALYFAAAVTVCTSGTFDCCTTGERYEKFYAPGDFPCGGPWTLDRHTVLISCRQETFPDTVTISIGTGGPAAPDGEAVWHDCCPDAPPPTLPSYNCVTPGEPCVDPGDESGAYASNEDCLAGCVGVCPTPPCGGGTDDGGGVGGLGNCCPARDEHVDTHLPFSVVRVGGDACLETVGALAWSNGFGVWIANDIKCGAFITYVVYCNGTDWCLKVYVNGVLVVDICGDYATDTGNCSPLSLLWSVEINVPGVAVGTYEIHVFES